MRDREVVFFNCTVIANVCVFTEWCVHACGVCVWYMCTCDVSLVCVPVYV